MLVIGISFDLSKLSLHYLLQLLLYFFFILVPLINIAIVFEPSHLFELSKHQETNC